MKLTTGRTLKPIVMPKTARKTVSTRPGPEDMKRNLVFVWKVG